MNVSRRLVLKFGGTSVSSLERWQTIKKICEERIGDGQTKVLVVCSALSGLSNTLENLIELALKGDYKPVFEEIKSRHFKFAHELGLENPEGLIAEDLKGLENLALGLFLVKVRSPEVSARILSFGERLLTKLAHSWLNNEGLPTKFLWSTSFLKSDPKYQTENQTQNYLNASCDGSFDEDFVDQVDRAEESLLLTQGFVGSNQEGETVLLGRGGSDVSAALMAAKMKADKLEIWSDVPGLFTSNPRDIPTARIIRSLDYVEAQEISFCGAKVLHPKCLEPLKKDSIPLELKWIERPSYEGTMISSKGQNSKLKVKAVIAKKGVYMISMDSVDMWQQAGFLSDISACFKRYGLSIDLVATSQSNVTVTLDALANSLCDKILDDLFRSLSKFCHPKKIGPCSVISLVGKNLKAFFPELGGVLEKFKEKNCYLMTQASSDLNFSFIVSEGDAEKIVESLHSLCFGGLFKDPVLGETWYDLYIAPKEESHQNPYENFWWYKRSRELEVLGKEKSYAYVYSKDIVKQRFQSLKNLEAVGRINFAMKSNPHPQILELLYEKGACFDCVSLSEVLYLKGLFPGMDASRILFTPNFAPLAEYEEALKIECLITLDNLFLLEEHGPSFEGKEIFLRLDPGAGRGHHPHVKTAGKNSKFGISPESLEKVKRLVEKYDIKVVGLHAHAGSGVLDPSSWLHTAKFLARMAEEFPHVKSLNLGGGLGVPDYPLQEPLDLSLLGEMLLSFSREHPQFELWLEPGRYLVAECGVLLASVTQLKCKADKNYLGLSTGMNSLIRPSLYGSYHELVNLSQIHATDFMLADVVGPICETGDVLGHDRSVPKETKEGDVILINNAGAYGRVMASSYNMREPAEELIL